MFNIVIIGLSKAIKKKKNKKKKKFVFPEKFSDCKVWVFLARNVFLRLSGSRYRFSTLGWRNFLAFFCLRLKLFLCIKNLQR